MIKFFKRIRKKLLGENRTAKYFTYAVGEIVLVVIGILIALQINNWNQKNMNLEKEKYLVKEMLQEFKKDSVELQNFIRLTKLKVSYGKMVKDYLKGKKTSLDSVFPHLFFNGKVLIFKSFSPTYDEIVSSGQLNLIRNDSLKSLIKILKERESGLQTFMFNDISEIKKNYNFHLYKYFDHEIMTELWKWVRYRDSVSAFDFTKGLKKDFTGFIKDPNSYYHVSATIGADAELHRSYSYTILLPLEKILNLLREEINND